MYDKKEISVAIGSNDMEVIINLPIWYEDYEQGIEFEDINKIGLEQGNLAEIKDKAHAYTKDEILEALTKNGVKAGIDEAMIDRIIERRLYEKDYVVARGIEPINGIDGYFEYLFETNLSRKPLIRPDGSADYYSIHLVELVKANQEVAIYHDPIDGKNGINVKGKVLPYKKGRKLPPMAGTGFYRVNDNHIYVSLIDGKIEYVNKRINIMPIYEIYGDVDIKTGNVDFRGDVIIHGNVRSGMKVNAVGTCTLDGVLEGAEVYADKDILIRGGIQGGERAVVRSKGDINAGYIEYANVSAEGNINADSIVNSYVNSHKMIKVKGNHSSIIGGRVYATQGIDVSVLGNRNCTKTEVFAGKEINMMKALLNIQNELQENTAMVEKLDDALENFKIKIENDPTILPSDQRKVDLLRAKVAKQADVAKCRHRLEYYNVLLERAQDATVTVRKEVYPGTEVVINSIKAVVETHQNQVQFIENGNNIRMYSGILEEQ